MWVIPMKKIKGYFIFIILSVFSIFIFMVGTIIIFKSFSFGPDKNIKELTLTKEINYKVETKENKTKVNILSKVFAKENKTKEEKEDIIAATISKIEAKFLINIKTKNKQNIKYKYKINAELNAKANGQIIKTKKYNLVPKKEIKLEEVNKEEIIENVTLDYEKYLKDNEDIKNTSGELVNSTLIVNMNITGESKHEEFSEFIKLKIPLTNQNKKIKIIKNYSKSSKAIVPKYKIKIEKYNYLFGGIIILIGAITLFATSILYMKQIKRIKEIKKIRKRITKLKESRQRK